MITTKQRSKLKGLANTLSPQVIIGKGELTDNVLAEIKTVLFHHELVKVSTLQSCTVSAKQLCKQVCDLLDCQPVLCIGNRFVVYKFSDKKEIEHISLD